MELVNQIQSLTPLLRAQATASEASGKLSKDLLELVYDHKWFKLFVPKIYGGLALSLLDGLRVEEALSRIDGSLGWTVTLCSGANLFVGFLDQTLAAQLFHGKTVCLSGSGKASGIAEITSNGYLVSGSWSYATGAPYATAFTANCQLMKTGTRLVDEQGEPLVRSFLFLPHEVQLIADWHTIGLEATASYSFQIENLLVSEDRCFEISPAGAIRKEPIYAFPFQQLAETTLAVNTLGMGQHFLSCCETIFNTRYPHGNEHMNGTNPHRTLNVVCKQLDQQKEAFYLLVATAWEQMEKHDQIADQILKELTKHSLDLVRFVRQQVALLYPYCGMSAANPQSEINRVWRDIFTASQHSLLV